MNTFNFDFGEDLPADLADAVRKSFSEPQDTLLSRGHSSASLSQTGDNHSPIASNINLTSMTNPNEILPLSNYKCNNGHNNDQYSNGQVSSTGAVNKADTLSELSKDPNTQEVSLQQQSDYQLFKHHYSVAENTRESITDILHELDIKSGDSISPQPLSIPSTNIVSENTNVFSQALQQQQNKYPEEVISQQEIFQQQLRNPFIDKADTNNRSNMNITKNKFDNDTHINPKTTLDTDIGPNIVIDNNTNIINQTTTRRSSIQNVQWIRQLLNPRSSFFGPSQTAMSVNNSFLQKYNISTESSQNDAFSKKAPTTKCWVTILKDGSIESIKSMIVLYHSLLLTESNYPMYILHDSSLDVSELGKYNIHTVSIPKEYFQNDPNSMNPILLTNSKYQSLLEKKWHILALFVSFINTHYELICYITPTSMIIDNIDELLDDCSINNEIDNETCVLLSNVTLNDSEEPQLIIFKPSNEVSMCIKEYFTLYGDTEERLHKIDKLLQTTDSQVLKELFGETWGNISSDGYITVFELDDESLNISNFVRKNSEPTTGNNAKILDFKNIEPWKMEIPHSNSNHNESYNNENNAIKKWYQIWQEFWNTYSNG